MKENLSIKFEKAIKLISEHFPISDENSRKSVLFHDIRVGIYLYENGYSDDVVLAGILHDTIEWSDITKEILEKEFGEEIIRLVLANSKNKNIEKIKRNEEMIKRCVEVGSSALIIKIADTIDSFKWYYSEKNENQLLNHCLKIAGLILKYKPKDFKDKILDKLIFWKEKVEKEFIK